MYKYMHIYLWSMPRPKFLYLHRGDREHRGRAKVKVKKAKTIGQNSKSMPVENTDPDLSAFDYSDGSACPVSGFGCGVMV
jgi:hypothetical protein